MHEKKETKKKDSICNNLLRGMRCWFVLIACIFWFYFRIQPKIRLVIRNQNSLWDFLIFRCALFCFMWHKRFKHIFLNYVLPTHLIWIILINFSVIFFSDESKILFCLFSNLDCFVFVIHIFDVFKYIFCLDGHSIYFIDSNECTLNL